MSNEEITTAQMRKYLSAFADGELDVESNLEVLQHLTMNTQATRRVMHLQQLKQNLQKHVDKSTPPMPESLAKNILVEIETQVPPIQETRDLTHPTKELPAATASEQRPFRLSHHVAMRFIMAAAIILLMALIWVIPGLDTNNTNLVIKTENRPTEVLLASLKKANAMTQRHTTCSKNIGMLGKGGQIFEGQLPTLLPQMATFMGVSKLHTANFESLETQAGYSFVKAGECHSGKNAIHLVFEKMSPDHTNKSPMSLWIMPIQTGQDIEADQLYSHSDGKTPLFFWRHEEVIYFLVCHDMQAAETNARHLMAI